jgi:hypothetical protein
MPRELTAFARTEYDRQIAFRDGSPARAGGRPYLARRREGENFFPSIRGAGGAIQFFRDRRIAWWSTTEEYDRPTLQMASSQIACVNFLLPLAAGHGDALRALLQTIDGDVVDVLPIDHEGRRSLVEFEWVGEDRPLEPGPFQRGRFCTSVDALILGRTATGIRAYLLEWKYTESCGETLETGRDSTRLRWYGSRYRASGLFRPPLDELLVDPAYQLVRSLLLGARMVKRRQLGVTEARTVVVCPEANDAYRVLPPSHRLAGDRALPVVDLMRDRVLVSPDRFGIVSQRRLLDRIVASGASTPAGWVDYHARRYAWR